MGIVQPQTAEALRRTAALYERVKTVIPPMEWAAFADDIDAILRLKKQRNAIILAHNYQTPEIFHGVADIRGDSLALAREAATAKADVIVMAGVHFMAETAKLLNPASTVLIPDAKAGCSLAESITAADVRLMRERYPGVPVVTYVNTSAAVKAESDICCTSGNAKKVIESLGVPQVIMLPDEYLAQNVAKETKVKIIAWKGHCEVHERFTAADIKKFRVQNPGVVVLAHPECPPEVVAASDFAGSTARMIEWVETKKPSRVVLLTECSMSDNVAASNPDVQFIRPCQLCPHMKRITLKNIRHALETMTTEVIVPADIAGCARLAVERMNSGGMMKTVIVGAGLAGLTAALALAPKPVVVLSPKKLGEECSSSWAQGGIAAAIDTNDSAASHAADTVKAGVGLCDAATVDAVTESGAGIIEKLVSRGVGFDRDAQNKLQLALEAAHSTRRVAHVADGTGLAIMQAMITAARATPSIEILENAFATQLLTEHGSITGVAVTHNGKPMMLEADSVVLATGGAGALWRHTTNPLGSYGGGLALAVRAGAQLADLEFMQFHPTAIDIGLDPMPLASEALRGEGCTLIGETGERFTDEMQPRDVVARAIDKHLSQKHRVFLDARTALGNNFVERFPGINGFCLAAGIDPAHAPIPVRPAAHYHMGGVATDLYGRTNIEGLWACGEVASTGLHGANRLASNSLLEAAAFGERVAEDISGRNNKLRHAREGGHPIWSEKTWDTRLRGYDKSALVREIMSSHVGISRDESGLKNAIDQLQPHIQTSDMALAAYMIAGFALLRQESRGAHTRSDFPATSKDWQYRQIFTLTELQAHLQQTEQPILQAVGV